VTRPIGRIRDGGHRGNDIEPAHAQKIPLALVIAWAHEKLGETEKARQAYGEARSVVERAETRVS
jgi:hypothetical protein